MNQTLKAMTKPGLALLRHFDLIVLRPPGPHLSQPQALRRRVLNALKPGWTLCYIGSYIFRPFDSASNTCKDSSVRSNNPRFEQFQLLVFMGIRSHCSMAISALPASLLHIVIAGSLSYICCLAIYRLWFHSLAKFPGPKLAALSYWYDFYHDLVKGPTAGRRIFEIEDLHARYGKHVCSGEGSLSKQN